MKKFTRLNGLLILLMVGFLFQSPILQAQDRGNSGDETGLTEQRQALNAGAQTQTMPTERRNAKSAGTFTVPGNGSRAVMDIDVSVRCDSWSGEASYNLWSWDDMAYYWATDQTFASGYELQTHILALEEGSSYDVDCFDSYGDGGIAGVISDPSTDWLITNWDYSDYGAYGAFNFTAGPGAPPVPLPTAVTTFPYTEDFEGGVFPATMVPVTQTMSNVTATSYDGQNCAKFIGGSSYWKNTPANVDVAFFYVEHVSKLEMEVTHDGTAGLMTMEFDLLQRRTFSNSAYEWFRVSVNGTPIADVDGNFYQQPSTSADPWTPLVYDLSAYQGLGTFQLTLENSGKYDETYNSSYDGDIGCVDNFNLYYITIGDVEGYVFNGAGQTVAGATVEVDGVASTTTNGTGYYYLANLPSGDNDVVCSKTGYNVNTQVVAIVAATTVTQDFTLTSPNITVSPLIFNELLHPNEYLTKYLSLLNTGDGIWNWGATLIFPPSKSTTTVSFNSSSLPSNWNGVVNNTNELSSVNSNGGTSPLVGQRDDILMYDDGTNGSAVGLTAGGTWQVSAYWPASVMGTYAGEFVKEVEVYANDLNSDLSIKIYDAGTTTTTGALLYEQAFVPPAVGWFTVVLATPVSISGNDMWIGYEIANQPGGTYPAGTDGGPAVAGYGDMITMDGVTWAPLSGYGLNYNWNIHALVGPGGGASGWLSLDEYAGYVAPGGGTVNIGTNFDASGTVAGEVYTADIVITSDPDVGTITVPVTMTIGGEAFPIISGFEAELTNQITGEATLTWNLFRDVTLQYYMIFRNGAPLTTVDATVNSYVDMLPTFGTYDYELQPVFLEGIGIKVGPESVEWYEPELCMPLPTPENTQWPGQLETVTFEIGNCATEGLLTFDFPDYSGGGGGATCDYEVVLYDSYGDGWNGGALDVYVDGDLIVSGATVSSGSGPEAYSFAVSNGAEITTVYTAGGWPYENSYDVVDCGGNVVYTDGAGSSTPSGIPAGVLFANVPIYIVSVEPAMGIIDPGATQEIVMQYTSVGWAIGDYYQGLTLVTNEPTRAASRAQTHVIDNWMHVVSPGIIDGQVTDCNTGQPMANVTITADNGVDVFTTETTDLGTYELYVNELLDYDVTASLTGYQPEFAFAAAVTAVTIDFTLCEEAYPVTLVTIDPNEADTECLIEWTLPMGPYLIVYDDGTADDYFAWVGAGGMSAVKFTPAGYPATVEGGRVFVGDGSFPVGGDFIGTDMEIMVFDDDGENGLPGTAKDSITVTVTDYGWVDVNGFNVTFEDGDFYIVYRQLGTSPNVAPVGVDESVPTVYRSYVKANGGAWMVSSYQDMMIRAIVSGPGPNVLAASVTESAQVVVPNKLLSKKYVAMGAPSGKVGVQGTGKFIPVIFDDPSRDLENYQLYRVSGIDPPAIMPPAGVLTLVSPNLTVQTYNDDDWGALPAGFYAYAVTATYTNGDVSDIVYSNIAAHKLDNEVTINVTQCDELSPEGAVVTLTGQDWPNQVLSGTVDATGIMIFDSVIDGTYDLVVVKTGYTTYIHNNLWIYDDFVYDVILQELMLPARKLFVEPTTSVATWRSPYTLFLANEGFDENTDFPPAGWQTQSMGAGWTHTDNGSSAYWTIPAGDGYYACANDDDPGSTNDGCCDYLIMPAQDLSQTDGFLVQFDAFMNGAYGQLATVEYSLNGGASWTVAADIPAANDWTTYQVDMDDITGNEDVLVAFHANDNGAWASGLAIDNVSAFWGIEPVGYYVSLDGGFVAETGADVTTYTYQNLVFGQEYEAEVRALYSCGTSDPIFYTFTSGFLYPPRNLLDEYVYNTNEVPLFWNPPMTVPGPGLRSVFDPNFVSVTEEMLPEERGNNTTPLEGSKPLSDSRSILFENGPLVNSPGTGAGGADESLLQDASLGMGTYGFGVQLGAGNSIADDFEVVGTWTIDFFTFYAYQTGSGPPSTITGCYFQVYDGDPSAGGAVIYGDLSTNVMVETDWSGIYRGLESSPGASNRPIMYAKCEATGLTLGAGTYWVEFTVDGSGSSGPWSPPITINGETTTGNALQYTGSWGPLTDVGQQGSPFIIEGSDGSGGGGTVPTALVSFNVYRDQSLIANVPYEDQGVDEWVMYVENNLMPGCYAYEVSAVYDLTDYGFPGDFGESVTDGPVEVCVVWGIDLPFCEDWTQGTFAYNGWTISGDNWEINANVGNDAPSAQWNWDPDPGSPYESSLTSAPFTADMLAEGHIYVDFDLALNDRNATGEEKMLFEVFDGSGWYTVETFDNEAGSFDFTTYQVDVTDYAMGEVFQVRFTAMGLNSFDVIAWNVDNICIYRECDAPYDLTGEYQWNTLEEFGAQICWEAEASSPGGIVELIYDNDIATGGYSYNGYVMGTHMSPDGPCQVLKLKYFTTGTGAFNAEVYDWAGSQPGTTQLYISGETVVDGDWLIVDIESAGLEVMDDFVVGFGSITGDGYLGFDAGLNNGRSWDYDNAGTWASWSEAYLIRAIVEYPDGSIQEIGADNGTVTMAPDFSVTEHSRDYANVPVVEQLDNRSARALTFFNIYRSTDEVTYEIIGTTPAEEAVTSYCYFDTDVIAQEGYYYMVTANYESEFDACESAPAMAVAPSVDDFVYVFVTGISNPDAFVTNLFPNPAQDRVTVTSSVPMAQITVTNYVGQVVYTDEMKEATSVELNTSSYQPGVYLVKIDTENGVVTKRVIITR